MGRALFVIGLGATLLGGAPAFAMEVPVTVERVTADGSVVPVVGREVALETWKTVPGPGADRKLDAVKHGTTDARGQVRFGSVAADGRSGTVASVVHDGVTYVSESMASGGGVQLRVYDATDTLEDLSGRMTVGLDVRDGFVIVDTALALSNRSRLTVDTRRMGRGFRVPIALPAVFGGPWEAGVIPWDTGPRHVSQRATPERGRFQFLDGSVYYQGPIPPGRSVTLQLRYALPIIAERQDLALTSPVPLEQLMVTTTWTDRVAPRVVPDREFLAVGREPGEAVQRFLRVEPPPEVGEAFVLYVDRLPQPDAVQNQLAIGGSVLLVIVFGLSLVALRRRDA